LPRSFKKDDLRVQKTVSALLAAICVLLDKRNFIHITVNDICEEAQISRATFYAHYNDKYDLLEDWLRNLNMESIIGENPTYAQIEKSVNEFVRQYEQVIKNIVEDANTETLTLLYRWLLSKAAIMYENGNGTPPDAHNIVLSNFYAGGLIWYLTWHVSHKFPSDIQVMNQELSSMLAYLLRWDEK